MALRGVIDLNGAAQCKHIPARVYIKDLSLSRASDCSPAGLKDMSFIGSVARLAASPLPQLRGGEKRDVPLIGSECCVKTVAPSSSDGLTLTAANTMADVSVISQMRASRATRHPAEG